jgi:hypothetical protein
MKLSHHLVVAASAACLFSIPGITSAQSMRPGLWEITTQMQGASGGKMDAAMAEMQKQMAAMSPDQRKMVEERMAKQGMKFGGAPGGGMKMQMCMTQEMVDRNEVASRQQGNCTQTRSPRTGNSMKFAFECTNPSSKGEGTVTFSGPDAYAMKLTTTTTVQGKAESMDMQGSGKWLSADCGNVKPLPTPK